MKQTDSRFTAGQIRLIETQLQEAIEQLRLTFSSTAIDFHLRGRGVKDSWHNRRGERVPGTPLAKKAQPKTILDWQNKVRDSIIR